MHFQVKVVGSKVVINCCHEERSDKHGVVKREISRTYHLPDDVDTATIKSHLSPRGVLTISANKKK
jgi:HSP20 family molecular chaperone IbpA